MTRALESVSIDSRPTMLSPREQEVVRLVVRGLSNKEVARELSLTEGTVKLHLHSVFKKLGAKNRYGLISGRLVRRSE